MQEEFSNRREWRNELSAVRAELAKAKDENHALKNIIRDLEHKMAIAREAIRPYAFPAQFASLTKEEI